MPNPIEQLGEQPDELLPLLRRSGIPVRAERASRRVGIVEDLFGDLADRRMALGGLVLERGILEHLHGVVDALTDLIRGRAGNGRDRGADDESEEGSDHDAMCKHAAERCNRSAIEIDLQLSARQARHNETEYCE